MTTKLVKPIKLFVPFSRVDDEKRIVEGYCYTKGRVPSDPYNLKRGTLKRSADKYMEFPAVREMHDPTKAAGTGMELVWDDTGCLLRSKCVDDDAWRKIKEGVYRGYSIGGTPKLMRGDDIEDFDWIETSYVDRPADSQAVFTLVRTAEFDPNKMVEVTVLPAKKDGGKGEKWAKVVPPVTRSAEGTTETPDADALMTALDALPDTAVDVARMKTKKIAKMAKKMGKIQQALSNQYRAAHAEITRRGESVEGLPAPTPAEGTAPAAQPDPALMQRVQRAESLNTSLQQQHAALDRQLKKTEKRLARMERQPASPSPVRFPAALERDFTANHAADGGTAPDGAALRTEYDALVARGEGETDGGKRQQIAGEISLLKNRASEAGISL